MEEQTNKNFLLQGRRKFLQFMNLGILQLKLELEAIDVSII